MISDIEHTPIMKIFKYLLDIIIVIENIKVFLKKVIIELEQEYVSIGIRISKNFNSIVI